MPKLDLTPKNLPLVKGIILGYSGEGKSGAMVSLGIPNLVPNQPAYELRVLDFDGKFEEMTRAVLKKMLNSKKINQEQHDQALTQNYDICVCRERTTTVEMREGRKSFKGIGVEGTTTAWVSAVKQLDKWRNSWDDSKILVVDSLTYAARAAGLFGQELNNKLNRPLIWKDYQAPQQLVENLLVIAADIPAHALILGHQDPYEVYRKTDRVDDSGEPIEELMDVLVLPISIGQSGRPKLPAQFNHMLMLSSEGSERAARRYIWTVPHKGIMCKTPFFDAKERYGIETGMAEYFALRG